MTENTPSRLGDVITIDDERIKSHLDRVVRGSVEETLNAFAQRYERSEARRDRRPGHYERKLQTKAGEIKLRITQASGADVRDGDHRALSAGESSVEEALIEMYLAGVSVRRVRGHHRSLEGHASVAIDGIGVEQEDLRNDRGLAQSTDRR
jgi:putative transposase